MDESQTTLDQIVETFAERLESGDQPTIEEYTQQYPHLASRIDAALRGLLILENIKSQPDHNAKPVDDNSYAKTIGEYQIIREIGRGGMGVVFEARHSMMRRRVALKVLPESLAENESYVSRFLIEARAAGRLHHTNIVPVFEVGQADGVRFYSMQFIDGDNLDRVIADIKVLRAQSQNGDSPYPKISNPASPSTCQSAVRMTGITLPTPNNDSPTQRYSSGTRHQVKNAHLPKVDENEFENSFQNNAASLSDSVFGNESTTVARPGNVFHRRVAAVGIQIAEALNYAHKNGVLHRDIKPANLILDTEGTVWITDFGLAKHEDDLTKTGDVIGTLRYMAPERFSGIADSRSDIYSLGLSLYELCTLRTTFDGIDQAELIKNIQQSKPIPPRKIDASIPTDLETIILKSIETQPERRYQSGLELAEDLRRFLADRPIKARRISLLEHFYRTCRRNPVTSSLLTCILGLLILLTAGSIRFAMVSAAKSEAETETRKQSQFDLYETKLDQARLSRQSRQLGQRFAAIDSIETATEIATQLDFTDQEKQRSQELMRDEAIAAFSLTDMREIKSIAVDEHWGMNGSVAFDSSHSIIAEGNPSGEVRFRFLSSDGGPNQKPTLLPPHQHPARILKLSPDGRYLGATHNAGNALYRDVELVLWDLHNPQNPMLEFEGVVDFEFDDQSQQLAVSIFRKRVDVISLEDVSKRKTLKWDFEITPRLVRFSITGDQLAVSSGAGSVAVWSLKAKPEITNSLIAPDNITAMDWGSDLSILAVGTRHGKLFFWRDDLSIDPQAIAAHQDEVTHLHIHPDRAMIATQSIDSTIRMNNLAADQESLRIPGSDSLLHCGFGANGVLGFFNLEKAITGIWEVANPLVSVFNNTPSGIGQSVAFHPTKTDLVIRSTNSGIEFWDIKQRRLAQQLDHPNTSHFILNPQGNLLFTCGGGGIEKWPLSVEPKSTGFRVRTGKATRIFEKETDQLALNESGDLLVAGTKFDMVALRSSDGSPEKQFGRHTSVNSLFHTKGDQWLLSGTLRNQGVIVWNWQDGKQVKKLLPHIAGISVATHPNDPEKFATADQTIRIWNANDWSSLEIGQPLKKRNSLIRYSPDGSMLSVNNGVSEVTLFDSENGKKLAIIRAVKSDRIIDFCWSSDGTKLALSCYDSLQIVDLETIRSELQQMDLDW